MKVLKLIGTFHGPDQGELDAYLQARLGQVDSFMWESSQVRDHISIYQKPWVALVGAENLLALILYIEVEQLIEISYLETNPNHRRLGHMKNLFSDLLTGKPEHAFWIDVHQQNQAAIDLYKSLGFVQTGLRKGYYRDGGTSLQLNRKPAAS